MFFDIIRLFRDQQRLIVINNHKIGNVNMYFVYFIFLFVQMLKKLRELMPRKCRAQCSLFEGVNLPIFGHQKLTCL